MQGPSPSRNGVSNIPSKTMKVAAHRNHSLRKGSCVLECGFWAPVQTHRQLQVGH